MPRHHAVRVSSRQNCAACHGSGLTGNGEAPALVGAEFISDWAGLTVGDLFDRIKNTMPQDNPGKLTRDQYADILAFVMKENGYPAGQKELDRRSEYLKAIAFVPPPAAGAAKPHASAAAPVQMAQANAGDFHGCGPGWSPRAGPCSARPAIPAFRHCGIGCGQQGVRRPFNFGGPCRAQRGSKSLQGGRAFF